VNRLATRLSLAIAGVALLTTLLALLQVYVAQRQLQQLPAGVRDPLMAITDGLEQQESPTSLRPQFEALIEGLTQNYDEVRTLDVRFSRLRDRLLVFSIGVLVVLSVTLALFLARRISGPITAVAGAAARIAEGDLSARAALPHYALGSRDETAMLAHHFNAMAAALEQLERERQALIADIAHELRTPLTILQGQLDAMQDGIVPFDQSELGKLDAQTELLSRLIDDLRTLSLADAKRLTLERVLTDLVPLARRVCESFQEKAQRQGLTLDFRTTAPHAPLEADPDRLAQVLTNLLENAVRYTPPGGWVGVSVKTLPGGLELSVEDTGPGLSGEAQARVFERFYRAETSRGRAGGGSGLGLAIVRTLVELHGGRVEAHNRTEGGAAFHVTLPRE
jgi:signal transduction histidine kinase